MPTYGDMINRVATQLRRSNLTDDISDAIQKAIQVYSGRRFWFNDSKDLTFTTSSSLETYTPTGISDYGGFDFMEASRSTTDRWEVKALDYQTFQEKRMGGDTFGDPLWYSVFNRTIYLWPIPGSAINVVVSGRKGLTTLSSTADSNAWTNEGEVLIRTRATVDLYRYVIKDFQKADVLEKEELKELSRLRAITNRMLGSGRVKRRYF